MNEGAHGQLSSAAPHRSPFPASLLQKSPILTPEELQQQRLDAERRLEEELAAAKAARAARAEAEAEAERAAAAQPKTEMERLREKERREAISRAQLSLLVGGWGVWRVGCVAGVNWGAGRALPQRLHPASKG